jgi:hypothetical protein
VSAFIELLRIGRAVIGNSATRSPGSATPGISRLPCWPTRESTCPSSTVTPTSKPRRLGEGRVEQALPDPGRSTLSLMNAEIAIAAGPYRRPP